MWTTTTIGLKNALNSPGGQIFLRGLGTLLFVTSLLILFASSYVTYFNVLWSWDEISDIAQGKAAVETSSSSQDENLPSIEKTSSPLRGKSSIPPMVKSFLVDLSVVTPGLVVATGWYMTRAALFLIWPGVPIAVPRGRRFPFPSPYKTYYIQMGLLGTIVGFVIAFWQVDVPTADQAVNFKSQSSILLAQSNILLAALGTALWSTLMAIVLAYLVCPVVEGMYQRLGTLRGIVMQPSQTPAVDQLQVRAAAAAQSLETLTQSVNALNANLDLHRLWTSLATLESAVQRLTTEVSEIRDTIGGWEKKLKALSDNISRIKKISIDLRKKNRSLNLQMRTLDSRVTAVERWEGRMKDIEKLGEVVEEFIKKIKKSFLE